MVCRRTGVVLVALLAVLGVRALTSGDTPSPITAPTARSTTTGATPPVPSTTAPPATPTTPDASAGPTPSADSGTPAAPSGVTAVPLPQATIVRFEVFSAGTAPVSVTYGSDNVSPTRLDGRRLPFAVQAPLTPANDYLHLSASDLDTQALLMCRLFVDGVLVSLDVGKGYATCSTSRGTATPTAAQGSGARLATATPAAPGRATVPPLAPSPTDVTYQVNSSRAGGRVDVSYGTDSSASVERDSQPAPFAVRLPIPASSDFLGVTATDVDGDPGPYLVCQVRIDGVLVEQSQGFRSVSCDLSPDQLYG